MQELIILDSARKRGIPDDDILHAYRNPVRIYPDGGGDDMDMLIGPTRSGALLEVGLVRTSEGQVVVPHVMPARPKFL